MRTFPLLFPPLSSFLFLFLLLATPFFSRHLRVVSRVFFFRPPSAVARCVSRSVVFPVSSPCGCLGVPCPRLLPASPARASPRVRVSACAFFSVCPVLLCCRLPFCASLLSLVASARSRARLRFFFCSLAVVARRRFFRVSAAGLVCFSSSRAPPPCSPRWPCFALRRWFRYPCAFLAPCPAPLFSRVRLSPRSPCLPLAPFLCLALFAVRALCACRVPFPLLARRRFFLPPALLLFLFRQPPNDLVASHNSGFFDLRILRSSLPLNLLDTVAKWITIER